MTEQPTYTQIDVAPAVETPAPTPKVELSAEQIADKHRLAEMKNRIKNGESLNNAELVFYKLEDSVVTGAVIEALENGGGYTQLKIIGLTEKQTLDVMSIYNVKTDARKYESEVVFDAITAEPALLGGFMTYLSANKIETPSLLPLFNSIRAIPTAYAALRDWHK